MIIVENRLEKLENGTNCHSENLHTISYNLNAYLLVIMVIQGLKKPELCTANLNQISSKCNYQFYNLYLGDTAATYAKAISTDFIKIS